MKEIRIEKITLNIGCGEAGEKLEKAKKLLEVLTNRKIVVTKAKDRTTFGASKGRPLGCKITLRGDEATEFLKKALDVVDSKLNKQCFDRQGNFSFGIKEHIHLPGVKYDPEIGIFGMDVCVTLERRGFRVKRRGVKIGASHKINPEETQKWIAEKFKVEVV